MLEPFDPLRAVQLAGTVSIPNPFPERGRMTISPLVAFEGKRQVEDLMLRIEHVQSSRLTIARSVWFEDIEAIYFADDPANPDVLKDLWLFPAHFDVKVQVVEELAKFESRKGKSGKEHGPQRPIGLVGTVFVKEQASVLMEVQVGMTAAESAEYCPPRPYDFMKPMDCH